jgi:predicted aminopeptidase
MVLAGALRSITASMLLIAVSGCADLGYYLQSIDGQMQLNAARRPLAEVIGDAESSPSLKQKLTRAAAIRDFASRELKLPDNGSYRSYADLKRPFVVWNVFAAEEFSIEPQRWCFPFAGCVGYRGYFSKEAAEAFAATLRAEGLEVQVAGIPAYSTLGWFDDPLLNTFMHYPDYELARLLFHELAHQIVYVKDDAEFNESFAVAVESAGLERWLAQDGEAALREGAARAQEWRRGFNALVRGARDALAALYRSRVAPEAMRERKAAIFSQLKSDYAELKKSWGGFAGYDVFFDNINNAQLAAHSIYNLQLSAMQRLLARTPDDFAAFYAAVRRLAEMPKAERDAALAGP